MELQLYTGFTDLGYISRHSVEKMGGGGGGGGSLWKSWESLHDECSSNHEDVFGKYASF